jgi:hypothetical protein
MVGKSVGKDDIVGRSEMVGEGVGEAVLVGGDVVVGVLVGSSGPGNRCRLTVLDVTTSSFATKTDDVFSANPPPPIRRS